MEETMVRVPFSFLASGPTYDVPLPSDFDPLPNISTPLFNGKGGRSFDYIPSGRDSGLNPAENVLTTVLSTEDGHTLEVWQRLEAPLMWWVRWPLNSGTLYTHLREWDGLEMAEVYAVSISIQEDPIRPPFLLLELPLKYAASANPGYSETAIYLSQTRGKGWSVALQRPGFLARGIILQSPSSVVPYTILRAGAADGMEVKATSPLGVPETRDLLDPVLEAIEIA